MTTYFPFAPPPRQPFTFQPTLDGVARKAVCTWSLFGNGENAISQRWYVSVFTLTGTRVFTVPRIGSPDPQPVGSAAWDGLRQRVVLTTIEPHGLEIGRVAALTFRGFTPAVFNVVAQPCVVLDPSTVAYPLATDPGAAVVLGSFAQEVNLAAGYFTTSTLVYRTSATRFEVDP